MRDLFYHAAWLVMLPLCFASAHLAVLVWIWVAILPPTELLYGRFGIILPFNKFAAAAAFFALIVHQSRRNFYLDGLSVLVLLYAVIVTLSYFLSQYSTSFSDVEYDKFWKELVLFFLITGVMFSRHRLHQVALALSISLGFIGVKEGLIFLLTVGGHKIAAIGSMGDNNGVAMALLMGIPFVLYCAKYTAHPTVRLTMLFVAGLFAVTVVATYSRGGFIGLIALGLMLLKNSRYKIRALIAVAAVAAVVLATAPDTYFERIHTISDATADNSFEVRLLSWKINYFIATEHPFIGAGPYASLVWQHWQLGLEHVRTWLFVSPLVLRTYVAHSIYFQALGDTGFIGFFLFVSILLLALWKTWMTQRIARRNPGLEWSGELARATQISLVVYMVTGAALSLIYFELLYILLAVISRNHKTARQLSAAQAAGAVAKAKAAWLAPAAARAA